MIKRLGLAFGLLLLWILSAQAQTVIYYKQATGLNPIPVSVANPLPIVGTITASLGAFAPTGAYATLAVTTSSANVALPAGTTVVVYNTGANNASIALGTSNAVTATTSEDQISAGCYATYVVGSNTYLAAITVTSTTSLVLSGGTGLPSAGCAPNVTVTGAAVYGPTAAASPAANPPVLIGGTVDGTATGNVDNWKVASGIGYVSAAVTSSALPTGAATSANQTSQITQETATAGALGTTTDAPCTLPATTTACSLIATDKAAANAINSPPPLGTTGGITPLKLNALTNTAVAIKASGGQLFMLQCGNTNASEYYVQVYNVAAGSVTVGTTAPTLSIPIAATSTGGFALSLVGLQFGTAISAAWTTTATGGTAPGTAADCNVGYN